MKEVHNRTWIFDAPQTNKELLDSAGGDLVTASQKIGIVYAKLISSGDCTVNVEAMLAFGATEIPALTMNSANGQPGFAINHGGVKPGAGEVNGTGEAVIAVGAAGINPIFSCSEPTGGDVRLILVYMKLDAEVVT
jgi:hypothetical protein